MYSMVLKDMKGEIEMGVLLSFVGAVVLTGLASYGAYAIYRDTRKENGNEDEE